MKSILQLAILVSISYVLEAGPLPHFSSENKVQGAEPKYVGCTVPFQFVNPYYHELTARTCANILGFKTNQVADPIELRTDCDCMFPFAMNFGGICIREDQCNEWEAFGNGMLTSIGNVFENEREDGQGNGDQTIEEVQGTLMGTESNEQQGPKPSSRTVSDNENSKEGEDDIDETGSDDDDCCCDESIPECDEYDSDAEQNERFDQTKIQNESNFTNTPIGSVSSSNFNPTSSQNINEQPLPSSPGMDMP